MVQYYKACNIYQRWKQTQKRKYSFLPEKEGEVTKYSGLNVDLWGPKTVKIKRLET